MKGTDLMVLDRFSGRAKGIIVLCCILLVVAGFLFVDGYTSQAGDKKHAIQLHLQKVAGRMAGQVNGDGLLTLKPGDEGTPLYHSFATALYEGRKNDSFIVTSYLLRVDNGTISYVVHDAYLLHGPDEYVVRTGEPVTEDIGVILNATIAGPVYSPDIYTSKWGSYISGYAPVRDSNGTVVGVLGVDESADTVLSYDTYQFFNLVEVS
jgi:hypothetical protein